jgi:hypothetical protein
MPEGDGLSLGDVEDPRTHLQIEEELAAHKRRQVGCKALLSLSTSLHCTALHCTALHRTALHRTSQAVLDNIAVLVATVVMVLLAIVIVSFKVKEQAQGTN